MRAHKQTRKKRRGKESEVNSVVFSHTKPTSEAHARSLLLPFQVTAESFYLRVATVDCRFATEFRRTYDLDAVSREAFLESRARVGGGVIDDNFLHGNAPAQERVD